MLTQDYSTYTPDDQEVWSVLYNRQWEIVRDVAYAHFAKGLESLHFSAQAIPDFTGVNHRLLALTGWSIYAVEGLIPNDLFFSQMLKRKFGSTTWLRKREQLDYLEEPDMFHDMFGHVPLLTDPVITPYLYELAAIADQYQYNEEVVSLISRLYWYTIEFGMVRENGELKIYGAGLLSSPGETRFSVSDKANHKPFSLEEVIAYPYIIDTYQAQYYVLSGMQQLPQAVTLLREHINRKYGKGA